MKKRHDGVTCKLLQIPVRMPQPSLPGIPAEPGNAIDEQKAASPASDPSDEREELPAERSRFSRWLASFGLGETPIPLLRPRRVPTQPGGPLTSE